jgi:hypothetical protein
MRKTILAAMALAMVCGLTAGCTKAKPTEAVEPTEVAKIYKEATAILEKVTDKESVEDAKPKLKELAERLKKLNEANREQKEAAKTDPTVKLPTHSETQKKLLEESQNNFVGQYTRVKEQVPGGGQLLDDFFKTAAPEEAIPKK